MTQDLLKMAIMLAIIIAIAPLLGRYIARVFLGEESFLDPIMSPLERFIFMAAGVEPAQMMVGWQYLRALLFTNLCMGALAFTLLVTQRHLPFNPMKVVGMRWDLALHTTISFLTNTGQQHYMGEKALSYLSQTSAIAFLMFVSAATGIAVGIACMRGLSGKPLGNFYVDLTKAITRILFPLASVGAIALLSLGVPETIDGTLQVTTLEGIAQLIARGPVASFESIKLLSDSGGGFFAANSAHPYENPSAASNFLELIMMLLIPAALIHTYGVIANYRQQARLLFWMVMSLFILLVGVAIVGELPGNPAINARIGIEQASLEGKEFRFGSIDSAIWAVTSSATMAGAANSMYDSLMPMTSLSIFIAMLMQIIWGAPGLGIAHLLIFVIFATFWYNLLSGRTPEFLGRKIEKREITLISVILLIQPLLVLIPSAIVLTFADSFTGISNPDFHGLSQVFGEYLSSVVNNGSGLEGLRDNTLWWNLSTSVCILVGRYIPIVAIILLADGMTRKPQLASTNLIFPVDNRLLVLMVAVLSVVMSFVSFFPVLALGPIAEGFKLASGIR